MSAEGQVRLATKTPLPLQETGKEQQPVDSVEEASAFARMLDVRVKTPAVVLHMASGRLEQADHGRGNWKEANM